MNNIRANYVAMLVQVLVIFVGLSVLLGRVYFQSYMHALGIPVSEASISVVEYSIIAPRVTILGIGIAIGVPLIYWAAFTSPPVSRFDWRLVVGGLIVWAIPTGFFEYFPVPPEEQAFGIGIRAAAEVVLIIISFIGAIVVGKGLTPSGLSRRSGEGTDDEFSFLKTILTSLVPLIAAFVIITQTVTYASEAGIVDANFTLLNAPNASIEFSSPQASGSQDTGLSERDESNFRVIFIGSEFIYIRSTESSSLSNLETLYALPLHEIKNISYDVGPIVPD